MSERLIKSKKRVQEHGEVFTPKWMVQKMLEPPEIQEKLHSLHGTFLEPSAGEGAFLVEILRGKLDYVNQVSTNYTWPRNALWALMSIYGIELMPDNVKVAKQRMIKIVEDYYEKAMEHKVTRRSDFYKSMIFIIDTNIQQGNFLTCKNNLEQNITFSFWDKVTKNRVQRNLVTLASMLGKKDDAVSAGAEQLSLFGNGDENTLKRETVYAICPVTKVYKEEKVSKQ